MFLPDKFVREPALLIPGRKPRGRVVVDWSHPLSKGLVACYLLGDGLRDLTRQSPSLVNNGANLVVGPNGMGLEFNGTSDYCTLDGDLLGVDPKLMTIVTVYEARNTGSLVFSRYQGDTLADQFHGWTNAANQITYRVGNASTDVVLSHALHECRVSVQSIDDFTNRHACYNGRLNSGFFEYGETSAELEIPYGATDDWLLGADADSSGNGSLGNYLNGFVYLLAIYGAGLSDGACRAIMRNPYQFLKPAGSAW